MESKTRNTSRFEYKYIICAKDYNIVKNALTPYLEPDLYTIAAPQKKYLVRSLYYDTYDLKAFHERNDGQFARIKLRIRTYTLTPDQKSLISFELKTKKGSSMLKYSSLVPYSQFIDFEKGKIDENNQIVTEFYRLLKVRSLQPQVIIQYLREGYLPKERGNLRITFDHNVCSAKSDRLFANNLLLKPHRPKNIILEIKCRDSQPLWLKKIVRKYGLKIITNSKYVQGIYIIKPYMVTPRVELGLDK